jgi:NAD(P)-dependent dehydrogenase (short-subunit alcohol dehydrogenase family)
MPSEIRKQALAAGRSPRLGEVEDIAAMVALLASKGGEWINGQTIAVDGGSCMN